MKRIYIFILCMGLGLLLFAPPTHAQDYPTDKGKITIGVTNISDPTLGLMINAAIPAYDHIWIDCNGDGIYTEDTDIGPDKIVQEGITWLSGTGTEISQWVIYGPVTHFEIYSANTEIEEINLTEATALQLVDFTFNSLNKIKKVTADGAPNLTHFEASVNSYCQVDLTLQNCPKLQAITINDGESAGYDVAISTVHINNLPQLKTLDIKDQIRVEAGEINLEQSPQLKSLGVNLDGATLSLPANPILEDLSFRNNDLDHKIDLSKFGDKLKTLYFNGSLTFPLSLENLQQLESAHISPDYPDIDHSIKISSLPKLRSLTLILDEDKKHFQSIEVENCNALEMYAVNIGSFTPSNIPMKISNCSNLQNVNLTFQDMKTFKSIDVNGCGNLETLLIEGPSGGEDLGIIERITLKDIGKLRKISLRGLLTGDPPLLLDLTEAQNLSILNASFNESFIDLRLPEILPNLRKLIVSGIKSDAELKIKGVPDKPNYEIYISGEKLQGLTLEDIACENNTYIDINDLNSLAVKNYTGSLEVEGYHNLATVTLSEIKPLTSYSGSLIFRELAVTELDLSNTMSQAITVENSNKLKTVTLGDRDRIEWLSIHHNALLENLDLSKIKEARYISVYHNNLKEIDLSGLTSDLNELACYDNPLEKVIFSDKMQLKLNSNLKIFNTQLDKKQFFGLINRILQMQNLMSNKDMLCHGLYDYLIDEEKCKLRIYDNVGNSWTEMQRDDLTSELLVYFVVPEGVEAPECQFVNPGESITSVSKPILNGVEGEWSTKENELEAFDFSSAMPNKNVKLYAYWPDKEFSTITLNVAWPNFSNNTRELRLEKNVAAALPELTDEYHTFLGWSEEKMDTEGVKEFTPTESMHTLYPIWELKEVTITVIDEDGREDTQFFLAGEKNLKENLVFTTPPYTKGYTLTIANTNPPQPVPDVATESMTLELKWIYMDVRFITLLVDKSTPAETITETRIIKNVSDYLSKQMFYDAGVPDGSLLDVTMLRSGHLPEHIDEFGHSIKEYAENLGLYVDPIEIDLTCEYYPPIEISFDTDGGSAIEPITLYAGLPQLTTFQTPIKDQYSFVGWYTDPEKTIPFTENAPVYEPLTLYAKWQKKTEPDKFTVRFVTMVEEKVDNQIVNRGEKATEVTLPDITNPLTKYKGWSLDKLGTNLYDFDTEVTSDLILYAVWKNVFTITFNHADGTVKEVEVLAGETAEEYIVEDDPNASTVFAGWTYRDPRTYSDINFDFAKPVYRDYLLEEKRANRTTATVDDNCSVNFLVDRVSIKSMFFKKGEKLGSLPTHLNDPNKKLVAWHIHSIYGDIATEDLVIDLKELYLVAEYEYLYILHFETNGGNEVEPLKILKGESTTKPNDPTKSGYTFKGWFIDKEFQKEFIFNEPLAELNTVIYAKWEVTIQTLTVTINEMNGKPTRTITVEKGELIQNLDDPTYDGFIFKGWFKDEQHTQPFNPATDPVNDEGLTLYAKWEAVSGQALTVTINEMNGKPTRTITVAKGELIQNLVDPTYDGFIFKGWFKDEQHTQPFNPATDPVNDEGLTLYAKWEAVSGQALTVTINEMNETPTRTITVKKGELIQNLDDPTYDGFIFKGWFKDEQHTQPFNPATDPVNDEGLTLYAKWEAASGQEQVQITFVAVNGQIEAINVTQANNTVKSGQKVNQGDIIKVTAKPNDGYTFKHFVLQGNQIKDNPYNLEVPTDVTELTLTAIFVKDEEATSNAVESSLLAEAKAKPNPFTETLIVEGVANCVRYALYDLQGRKLLHGIGQGERLEINSSNLLSGYYLLQLIDREGGVKVIAVQKR